MGRAFPLLLLLLIAALTHAQEPTPSAPTAPVSIAEAPLPDIRQLLIDVERHQKAAEDSRKDYTYHVHLEQQEFNKDGSLKKTTVSDSESLTIDGVLVNRVVARNGKPLTPDEAKKEDERISKEVAKDKERREKLQDQGKATNGRGDEIITASRILELGVFTNPRRVSLNDRPTIVADYAGDPHAKTHNTAETIIGDLVGTVWIDEQDHSLARGEGHMLNDFKIGGGLVLNVHKGFSFTFQTAKINNEVWLPAVIDARGSARYLLFGGIDGHFHLTASDYRKFRATARSSAPATPSAPTTNRSHSRHQPRLHSHKPSLVFSPHRLLLCSRAP